MSGKCIEIEICKDGKMVHTFNPVSESEIEPEVTNAIPSKLVNNENKRRDIIIKMLEQLKYK